MSKLRKVAVIKEEWPSIPGHAEEIKVYTVRVVQEYRDYILAKRHWWSRPKIINKTGMFVRVNQIVEVN